MSKVKIAQKMNRKNCQGFLSNSMKKYVTANNKSGYNVSTYNARLFSYSTGALHNDLPLLAEKLAEDIQAAIFDKENLMPFFRALFKVNYKEKMTPEETEKRRQRLLKLSYEILTELGVEARQLAPKSMESLLKNVPLGLRAIMMEAY